MKLCPALAGNGETPRPSFRILGRSFFDAKSPQERTPAEKVAILRRHLIEHVPISDLCDKSAPAIDLLRLAEALL